MGQNRTPQERRDWGQSREVQHGPSGLREVDFIVQISSDWKLSARFRTKVWTSRLSRGILGAWHDHSGSSTKAPSGTSQRVATNEKRFFATMPIASCFFTFSASREVRGEEPRDGLRMDRAMRAGAPARRSAQRVARERSGACSPATSHTPDSATSDDSDAGAASGASRIARVQATLRDSSERFSICRSSCRRR